MSKKQALTEFHRGSILAAAERLFAEKGTEKTTMDDIAREAESSKAAADDQHVGVNDFHEFFLGNPAYWAGGSERSSCLRIRPVF